MPFQNGPRSCLGGLPVILSQEKGVQHHPQMHVAFDGRLTVSRLWRNRHWSEEGPVISLHVLPSCSNPTFLNSDITGRQVAPFHPTAFRYNNEMPYELKSALYRSAYGKIGCYTSFPRSSKNPLTMFSEYFLCSIFSPNLLFPWTSHLREGH